MHRLAPALYAAEPGGDLHAAQDVGFEPGSRGETHVLASQSVSAALGPPLVEEFESLDLPPRARTPHDVIEDIGGRAICS
jgi:hypothetical protein